MPTITMLFSDLEMLVGKQLPRDPETLSALLSCIKGEVESFEAEELSVEVKDGNRPDVWSVEGIARALRGVLGIEMGLKQYSFQTPIEFDIRVDQRLQKIRPYIASSIVRNIRLSNIIIQEFMHLQEKLDQTYGRRRSRASIGLYDFSLIKPPLHYTVAKPTETSFIPLGSNRKMNLKEILEIHPKGLEYGHIIKTFKAWPLFSDATGHVLSFPPIINSADFGKITAETQNILIEVTGTDHTTVLNTLTLVTLSIADRGGDIYPIRVLYPYTEMRENITPNFATSEIKLELRLVHDLLGLDLSRGQIKKLLEKARYDVYPADSKSFIVQVPCYRCDIMHPVDIIEDIAIMYGYNNFQPRWPQLVTFGELSNADLIFDAIREMMVGLGFQEILTFSLTTPQNLFDKMNIKAEPILEILNPINERFTCLRSWLLPSLMEFLSNNTHISYPQRIFEVGECVILHPASKTGVIDVEKLSCLIAHSAANFSEIKAVLDAFLLNFGLQSKIEKTSHGTFIEGRVGSISVNDEYIGLIGEISPQVLVAWGIENPTIGFEIDLSKLFAFQNNL